ncbi:MAG: HPr family phosphocarrier protein [Myxococcota bacterium]|jgi:phosphocarrier protein|nr:HPr family phosphocarrier protein [Myxococcota bacterium]
MGSAQTVCKITNSKGLHVRAATLLAQLAGTFSATITIEHSGEHANAKSVMNLLLLTAPMGASVRVTAQGDDADDALKAVLELINNGFGE